MALHIPTDLALREGAGDVPPFAFDHTMAQSRGWVLVWICGPEFTLLVALDMGPSGWGMEGQERCPFGARNRCVVTTGHVLAALPLPPVGIRWVWTCGVGCSPSCPWEAGKEKIWPFSAGPRSPGRAGKRQQGCCWRQGCGTQP